MHVRLLPIYIVPEFFIRMNLNIRNILLSIKTNALGFDGVMFTNVPLLLSSNANVGINSLPFISIFSGPYSMLQRMSIVLLWFNPNAVTGYTSCSEALCIVNTKPVAVLLMAS